MVNRRPDILGNQIALIVLLGLEEKIDFEFHLSDWLPTESGTEGMPVLPEVVKLRGKKIFCLRGEEEIESLCGKLDKNLAQTIMLQGGHHFGGDYAGIASIILNRLK